MSAVGNLSSLDFVVAVRCRALNERERYLGIQRFPYRKDLDYKSAVCWAPNHQENGLVSLFDPDSVCVHTAPTGPRYGKGQMDPQDGERRYPFHHVFGEQSTNEEVYQATLKPLVAFAHLGYHGTCFAYGVTGSGKSHTMTGVPPRNVGEPRKVLGLCHYLLQDLFQPNETRAMSQRPTSSHKLTVQATFVELYNEKLRDLLLVAAPEPTAKNFPPHRRQFASAAAASETLEPEIHEDRIKGTYLSGVTALDVPNMAALEYILELGNARRTKAGTASNECSSRSHAILQLTLHWTREEDDEIPHRPNRTWSKLTLVDLAGSERQSVDTAGTDTTSSSRSSSTSELTQQLLRRREGSNINKSLLALGNCINALGDAAVAATAASSGTGFAGLRRTPATTDSSTTTTHIPYRDSKLTRLLKDSLGGNTKTVMIATISPSCLCYDATLATLKYATRAKLIAGARSAPAQVNRVNESSAATGLEEKPEQQSHQQQQQHVDPLVEVVKPAAMRTTATVVNVEPVRYPPQEWSSSSTNRPPPAAEPNETAMLQHEALSRVHALETELLCASRTTAALGLRDPQRTTGTTIADCNNSGSPQRPVAVPSNVNNVSSSLPAVRNDAERLALLAEMEHRLSALLMQRRTLPDSSVKNVEQADDAARRVKDGSRVPLRELIARRWAEEKHSDQTIRIDAFFETENVYRVGKPRAGGKK